MPGFCAQKVLGRASSAEEDGCSGSPLTGGGGTAYPLVSSAKIKSVEATSGMLVLEHSTEVRRHRPCTAVSHAFSRT
jgi:hypothetical protein